MGAAQEAVIREFLDAWGDGECDPDADKILSMFAEDAQWQLWLPGGPTLKGREAIGRDIRRQLSFCHKMKCGLLSITSSDRTVMTERLDTFVANGTTVHHHLMAVYDLDAAGKITAWREYFDYGDVERQLKAAAATVPRVET
jgi:limonene-1,2-epoxide hydrolase